MIKNANSFSLAALALVAFASPVLAQSTDQPDSGSTNFQFAVQFDAGAIVSLKRTHDKTDTDYLAQRHRLGDILIQFRQGGEPWQPVETVRLARFAQTIQNADGTEYDTAYQITNQQSAALLVESKFTVRQQVVVWTISLANLSRHRLEIGDLALPLPIGARSRGASRSARSPVILKHSFISGDGSFIFWTRSNSEGPCLVMTPLEGTGFEYWEAQPQRVGYRIYIHSAAAGAIAKEHGTRWRQPNTSLMLAPKGETGDRQSYGVKFQWADGYNQVRQLLVDDGKIDVQVVPGMTLPDNLFADIALRTRRKISSVEAEFPGATRIESFGAKGDTHFYKIRFSRLGENELTVHYGEGRHIYLEFFSTEPIETLFKKRAAFIASHQVRNPDKWYNGLFCEWNMENHVEVTPDNYDRLRGFRIYAATCDDAGLGHPAYLAAENAEYPVQSQVEALDYYITHFVWGGLQRTTNETYSYGIYGIPDWKRNRDSADPGRNGQLHIWRVYDYPHVILLYFSMYRIAKYHPEIHTAMTAREYLQRAYGTANAMFTVPHEVWNGWSAYGTGFYNELVIADLIHALEANGMTKEAQTLRGFWVRKVKNFVNGDQDLFRSEYAFDSTGFESTEAIAKYAMEHADASGEVKSGIPLQNARKFLQTQIAANLFCRGWLEPAYYYLGSDYRGSAGNAYTLSYMAQMGGWAVLDYGLNFAARPAPYLRLGYASFLSAWALLNSGTPESNYGYWYPGKANDGAAGGGFEPAPYGTTWLGQPHHRGAWYYACEIDLGFCGALRTAATVLEDDPIFGRICLGGDWGERSGNIEVVPKDGLRRRFHAMLKTGRLHFVSDTDRFPAGQPIQLKPDLSEFCFQLESDNPDKHVAICHLSGLTPGEYSVRDAAGIVSKFTLKAGREAAIALPMEGGVQAKTFRITREHRISRE